MYPVYQEMAKTLVLGTVSYLHELEQCGGIDRGDFFKVDCFIWRDFENVVFNVAANMDSILENAFFYRSTNPAWDIVTETAITIIHAVKAGISVKQAAKNRKRS